ncbi:unnamed protein product [Schistocephalus solidus]|uniref:Uncharacterized protein n=1 Tax=Schistocephalus solidus TaxID=70667 RepID=A0A183SKT7_SCHSO|nr:unnamed protein product [Schistocephalus solidus]
MDSAKLTLRTMSQKINVLGIWPSLTVASKNDGARTRPPLNLINQALISSTQSRPPVLSVPHGRSNGFANAANDPVEMKPDHNETSYSRERQNPPEPPLASGALIHCLPACYQPAAVPAGGAGAFRQMAPGQATAGVGPAAAASAAGRQQQPQSVEVRHLCPVRSRAAAWFMPPPASSKDAAFVPLRRRRRTTEVAMRAPALEHGSVPLRFLGPISAFTDLNVPSTVLVREEIPRVGGCSVHPRPTPRVLHPFSSEHASCQSTILRAPLTQSNAHDQYLFINHAHHAGLPISEAGSSQAPVPAGYLNGLVKNSSDPPRERPPSSVLSPSAEWCDTNQVQPRQHPPPDTVLLQVPSEQEHGNRVEEPPTSSSFLVLQNVSTSTYVPLVTAPEKISHYTDGTACIAVNTAVLPSAADWPWPRGSRRLDRSSTQSPASISSADASASDSDLTSFV